jgi:hypothetical protein
VGFDLPASFASGEAALDVVWPLDEEDPLPPAVDIGLEEEPEEEPELPPPPRPGAEGAPALPELAGGEAGGGGAVPDAEPLRKFCAPRISVLPRGGAVDSDPVPGAEDWATS